MRGVAAAALVLVACAAEQPPQPARYIHVVREEAAPVPVVLSATRPPPEPYRPKITYHMEVDVCADPRLPVVLKQCTARGDGHTQHRTFTCPSSLPFSTRRYAYEEAGYAVADCGLVAQIKHQAAAPCTEKTTQADPRHSVLDGRGLPAGQDIVTEVCP